MRLSFSTNSRYSTRSHQVIAPCIGSKASETERKEALSLADGVARRLVAAEEEMGESQPANPVPRWKERLTALRNTLPIFRMVWEASPQIVVANIGVRVIVALLPLAMLAVTKLVIDAIYQYKAHQAALPSYFWWLVGA